MALPEAQVRGEVQVVREAQTWVTMATKVAMVAMGEPGWWVELEVLARLAVEPRMRG